MRARRAALCACAAAALLLTAAPGRADNSVTGDWTTGNGYRGWDGRARTDLGTDDAWAVLGGFAWAHSKQGTESFSKQADLGVERNPDDNWSFRGTATAWKEYISGVDYVGPSWGFTYLATAAHRRRRRPFKEAEQRQPGEPLSNREKSPPDELWGLSFDNDMFFYEAPAVNQSKTVKVGKTTVAVPPLPSSVSLAQWHPYVEAEKPLFNQAVTPSVTLGHYFYTRNPGVIEERAGQPRFAASAGSLGSLASGLFKNTAQAAVDFALPLRLRFHAALGAEQDAADSAWATTQELSLKSSFDDWASLLGKWDRTIQYGTTSDIYTVGLSFYF